MKDQKKQHSEQPLLSIGMIFRDDIRSLEKCLTALQPLRDAIPCELVMADTGSKDGSRTVAERFANVLFDFPWINDFSAARNAVMERCTGRWFLTVDSDEYLDKDITQLLAFLTKKRSNFNCAAVTQRNYITRDMNPDNKNDFMALRLVRMSSGARYRGKIHEALYVNEGKLTALHLGEVVLHHDGYTTVAGEDANRKKKRNLPLLEEELEKEPESCRRIMQCIDSSYTPEQARRFTKSMIDLLEKNTQADSSASEIQDSMFAPAAMRTAVQFALRAGMPETEEWMLLTQEKFPDSIFVQVDVAYYAMIHWHNKKEPERCLEAVKIFWKGIDCFDREAYNRTELAISTVLSTTPEVRATARGIELSTYGKLKDWPQMYEMLKNAKSEWLIDPQWPVHYMNHLFLLWRKSDLDVDARLLQTAWETMSAPETEERYRKFFTKFCSSKLQSLTGKDEQPVWQLVAKLGKDNEIGRWAMLLGAESAEEAQPLLNEIQDWKLIPVRAIEHAVNLGCVFPRQFYQMETELVTPLARRIAESENRAEILNRWMIMDSDHTPGHVMWLFQLAVAATRKTNWEKHPVSGLPDLLCACSMDYLHTFFSPLLCEEANLHFHLPEVRFSWYLDQAQQALYDGDKISYVKLLHRGLNAAPSLKHMVEYLVSELKKQEELDAQKAKIDVTPELLTLAEQVRAILAQFSPDDPAVRAIKESDVYKKVAILIEPAVMAD